MSDRGAADEEHGDACNSDTKHTHRSAHKRITSHPVIDEHNMSTSRIPRQNGNRAQTNQSRNTTLAHRKPLESLRFKYIFMESGTDWRGIVIIPFSGCSVSPMLPSGVVLS